MGSCTLPPLTFRPEGNCAPNHNARSWMLGMVALTAMKRTLAIGSCTGQYLAKYTACFVGRHYWLGLGKSLSKHDSPMIRRGPWIEWPWHRKVAPDLRSQTWGASYNRHWDPATKLGLSSCLPCLNPTCCNSGRWDTILMRDTTPASSAAPLPGSANRCTCKAHAKAELRYKLLVLNVPT